MSDQPGYTRVPNTLLELLPLLPDAECRVLLAIARKTLGWQKACDIISLSQLESATGMGRQGVINGITAALDRGILKREPSGHNNGYCYEIDQAQVVHEVDHLKQSTKKTSPRSRPLVVHEVDHLSPQVVHEVDTQKKESKERKENIRAPRKSAGAQGEKSEHQKIMDAYQSSLGYAIRDGAKEGNAAKWLVKNGYTPDQVQACYDHLKQQAFWREKHISLQTIAGQIGAYIQSKNGHTNGKHIRQGSGPNPERKPQVEADHDAGW